MESVIPAAAQRIGRTAMDRLVGHLVNLIVGIAAFYACLNIRLTRIPDRPLFDKCARSKARAWVSLKPLQAALRRPEIDVRWDVPGKVRRSTITRQQN